MDIGRRAARGDALGGTALSNPMKSFFGIEHMRLKGRRSGDGYIVNGLLPYVSNLGDEHYFGAIFEVDDGGCKHNVMAIVPCAAEGVNLSANTKFLALDGTRTFSVQLRDVVVPNAWVVADPADEFVKRIRAGFVLLQAGMAFGLIRDCIRLMERTKGRLATSTNISMSNLRTLPNNLPPWKPTLRALPQRRLRQIPRTGGR